MIRYRFDAADLLHVRFALHPLGELLWAAAALDDPADASVHLPWMHRAEARLGGLDRELLGALGSSGPDGYGVDFPAPPPRTPLPDLDAELQRVAATAPAHVRREIERRWPAGDVPAVVRPLLDRPRRALPRLAALMREFWDRALAPEWPAIRTCLEADIAHRTRHLAAHGVAAVFGDLHRDVAWAGGELRVTREHEMTVELAGRGVLLVPAVFTWPRTFCLFDDPWQPTLLYPPIGVGDLWAPRAAAPDAAAALAPLLGARRAVVLDALALPASTLELSRRLGLPASSVSEHLAVLRDAGLVHGSRDGREVRYARTAAGDTLVAAPAAGP